MCRRVTCFGPAVVCGLVLLAGCTPSQPLYLFEDGDLSHYKGVATEIEYPDVEADTLADVAGALPPFTLADAANREVWDLSLEEALQNALANSKVMRNLGGAAFIAGLPVANQNLSPTADIGRAPGLLQTIYHPAITESDPRFGTEGALSQFDAQLSSSIFWEKNDRPVNLFFRGFLAPILEQDLATYRTELSKTTATGTRLFLRNNTSYEWNNNPSNRFPSSFNTDIEAEVRQPLLQGASVDFNRIAGPNGVPGFYNGIAIARINTDIALTDFEAGVRNLVSDVERAYWDLYFSYRALDAVVAGRDAALETWRRIYALYVTGARGGEGEKEAQAREQYFLFRGQVENALHNLYTAESRLRYMMGLAATDGRLIRPSDEPTTARISFDWNEVHTEALARSVDVRRQKWQVKQRELELTAAKNFLLPRLDAVGRYRWRGFGDDLIVSSGRSEREEFAGAYQELFGGNYQEWQLGLQLNVPIGFRQPLAAVRNAQLRLARERALLQELELDLSHQMAAAIRDLDRHYALTLTNFNRRVAAQRQVEAVQAAYETETVTLDLLLDAQRRLAEAESAYYRSLVDYNLAVLQVHFRKGSLLEYNGVYLAEGPWPAKAYFDARKRARERDAAMYINYGFTRPGVFSRGPMPQHLRPSGTVTHEGPAADATPPEGEELPEPTPAEPPQDGQPGTNEAGASFHNSERSAKAMDVRLGAEGAKRAPARPAGFDRDLRPATYRQSVTGAFPAADLTDAPPTSTLNRPTHQTMPPPEPALDHAPSTADGNRVVRDRAIMPAGYQLRPRPKTVNGNAAGSAITSGLQTGWSPARR